MSELLKAFYRVTWFTRTMEKKSALVVGFRSAEEVAACVEKRVGSAAVIALAPRAEAYEIRGSNGG